MRFITSNIKSWYIKMCVCRLENVTTAKKREIKKRSESREKLYTLEATFAFFSVFLFLSSRISCHILGENERRRCFKADWLWKGGWKNMMTVMRALRENILITLQHDDEKMNRTRQVNYAKFITLWTNFRDEYVCINFPQLVQPAIHHSHLFKHKNYPTASSFMFMANISLYLGAWCNSIHFSHQASAIWKIYVGDFSVIKTFHYN
jgi:hypothetical protein